MRYWANKVEQNSKERERAMHTRSKKKPAIINATALEMTTGERTASVISALSKEPNDLSLLVNSSRSYEESLSYWKFFSYVYRLLFDRYQ